MPVTFRTIVTLFYPSLESSLCLSSLSNTPSKHSPPYLSPSTLATSSLTSSRSKSVLFCSSLPLWSTSNSVLALCMLTSLSWTPSLAANSLMLAMSHLSLMLSSTPTWTLPVCTFSPASLFWFLLVSLCSSANCFVRKRVAKEVSKCMLICASYTTSSSLVLSSRAVLLCKVLSWTLYLNSQWMACSISLESYFTSLLCVRVSTAFIRVWLCISGVFECSWRLHYYLSPISVLST